MDTLLCREELRGMLGQQETVSFLCDYNISFLTRNQQNISVSSLQLSIRKDIRTEVMVDHRNISKYASSIVSGFTRKTMRDSTEKRLVKTPSE